MDYYDDMCRCQNSCHRPTPTINCNKIIEKYHCLIKEADELFEQADILAYKDAYGYICSALKALGASLEIIGKGIEISDKADMMLNKSGCGNKCNRNSCKCKELERDAKRLYDLEDRKLLMTMELLEKAMDQITEAYELDRKASRIQEKYIKCVHRRDCD